MKRKIITTADGSKTIHIEDWDEQYHSKHGAIQEAAHVFIKSGLHHKLNFQTNSKPISVLEIGFGTGLNAFLTLIEAQKLKLNINYVGVEGYPVKIDEVNELNYASILVGSYANFFNKLHEVSWEDTHLISSNFSITKRQQFFSEINDELAFDLIFFDAFGARVQPELWSKSIFQIMYNALKPNGVLVTYAAIGQVKRDMKSLGFKVERIEGPPGKRHMLRATK
ncbi:tRNA (5-methylaminomethyl-2-thiouridine)(34)-methyltransferase MnmD [Pontimicrobium sp. IMCC45349]|uniref:tRNA (5-methylaminomethyl-2-thiouridine)(34)-methyltransferase MnmD n=1 Tax=Pontimicrobium sp. IMCC45349 TaxID=3391574 RepID=UPI0039A11562